MVSGYTKKVSLISVTIFFITASFFIGSLSQAPMAEASFLDMIRALVSINPLELKIIAPSKVIEGEVFKIEARIVNKGEKKISKIQAEIFFPQDLTLISKKKVQKAGAIPAQKDKKVQWRIKGETSGKYIISVSVQGELEGQVVGAEATTMVIISDKVGSANTEGSGFFQRISDLWRGIANFFKTD